METSLPRTWSELGLRCAFVQPDDACPGPKGAPAVTSTSVKLSPLPTGVLEDSDVKDRPAVEKAKILYRSCMNESEWNHLPGPSQLQHHRAHQSTMGWV